MPSSGTLAVNPTEQRPLLPTAVENHTTIISQHGPVILGYSLMALAALCQSTRALLFHISEKFLHFPPSTALIMSAVTFITFSAGYVHHNKVLPRGGLTRTQLFQLAIRGLSAAFMLYLNNVALSRIPVGTSLTLFSTAPAITSIMAALFLGDVLSLRDIAILAVNFAGVFLVARPTSPGAHPKALVGVLSALGAAACSSVGLILVKVMGVRVHYMLNTLSIGLASAVLSVVVSDTQSVSQIWRNPHGALVTLIGACVGFGTQACVNRGVQLTRPGPALVVRSFNVPVSFVLGLVFLGEGVSFVKLGGVMLVLVSVTAIGLLQFSRERLTPEEQISSKNVTRKI